MAPTTSIVRVLITGIPGTGKTSLGDQLAKRHKFAHVDMEDDGVRATFRGDRAGFISSLPARAVISWGFHPYHDVEDILWLKGVGFTLFWFDGNRAAALRAFNKRGTVEEGLFHLQIRNIEATGVVARVAPARVFDPFTSTGSFKPLEEVADEVVRAIGHA